MDKKIRFILEMGKNRKPPFSICLKIECRDGQMKYSIGEKVAPEFWCSSSYQAKPSSKADKTYRRINKRIGEITERVETFLNRTYNTGESIFRDDISASQPGLRTYLLKQDEKLLRQVRILENPFFKDIDELIMDARSGKLTYTRKTKHGKEQRQYDEHSLRNWEGTRKILWEFDPGLRYATVSVDKYDQFINFCHKYQMNTGKRKNQIGLSENTIGKHVKHWKTFMKLTLKRQRHNNHSFEDEGFTKLRQKIKTIVLNEDEISRLIRQQGLTNIQELARDWFVIGLYTGLRISDLQRLNMKFVQDGYIILHTEKTEEEVAVEIDSQVYKILEKYGNDFPGRISDQTINREIKEVGRLAGLNKLHVWTRTEGGKLKSYSNQQFELLSTHTCRRSFITNMIKKGANSQLLQGVVGLSAATLEDYTKLTNLDKAKLLSKQLKSLNT